MEERATDLRTVENQAEMAPHPHWAMPLENKPLLSGSFLID